MRRDNTKKIEKLFEEFNKNTKKYNSIFPKEINRAKNHYKRRYRGEAFIGLAQVLEYQLHNFWIRYLINTSDKSQLPRKSLGLITYAEIMWNIGFLTTSQKSDLLAFQKGRNVIVHYTSKHFQIKGHPSDETLGDQFKKGVKIAVEFSNYFKLPEFHFDPKIFQQKTK
ncbi:MAG: hypothetical protein OEM28_11945 [Nitrosopumilus sp.]|nr:hypothetical protein [Nitrosopumilus sp.]